MRLHEFKTLLKDHSGKSFQLVLPTGSAVPRSFHITEVGRIQKTFLDCGGKLHESETCQLQVWVGEDEDHRLVAGKTAIILEKAKSFLPNDDIPVELEYEDEVISQYEIDDHVIDEDSVVLRLASKHTDCLAKEICIVPAKGEKPGGGNSCCATTGCCQ